MANNGETSPQRAAEKTLPERLTAPKPEKPGKRCGKYPAPTHYEHAVAKKTFEKPKTGFAAPGDQCIGHMPPAPSPPRAVIKIDPTRVNKTDAGLVVGSETRMAASVERARELEPSPKGKRNAPNEKKASNFTSAGYLDETESSARKKAKVLAERREFPAKEKQPNPWEKPGVDPTRALNMHLGHGVGVSQVLQQGGEESPHKNCAVGTSISPEELSRLKSTGAAGKVRSAVGAAEESHGKKPGDSTNLTDHVFAEVFNKDPSPASPHIPPPLDLSKIHFGKKQAFTTEKKSPQAQRRLENQFHASKKKDKHLQFSARRVHAAQGPNAVLKGFGSMSAIVSARTKTVGKNHCTTAVARKINVVDHLVHRDPNVMKSEPTSPARLTKSFKVEHKATSFDNDFARANHSNHSSPTNIFSQTAQILLKQEAQHGKRQTHPAVKNGSLKGILNPETPRKRKPFSMTRPFGDHSQQEIQKSASPARIGWHGAASSSSSSPVAAATI